MVGNLIGDGQYGSVYEAQGPFDELYALKMYRPANRHYETVKQEWSAEMKRLESFRHPNIVYIYDAFEVNHLFYIALERCETSLRSLWGLPFQPSTLFEFARQLLMALDYLHDNGLVHADLHGGNVLVTQLRTHPVIKLTDFGVAHQLRGEHWFRPQVANPKILTPELVTAGYTTRQSDLYQLGLLMFRMHTGYSAIPEGVQYHDFTRLIAEGAPRQRAEQLGTPMGNIIAKLVRRRDAYRYQTAREVWEDLRHLRPPMPTGQHYAVPTQENGHVANAPPPSPSHPAVQTPSPSPSPPAAQAYPRSAPQAAGSHPGGAPPPEHWPRHHTPTPPMGATPPRRPAPTPDMGEITPPVSATPTPPMGMPAFAAQLGYPASQGPPSSQPDAPPPSRTEAIPPSRTDVTPPSRTDVTPPAPPSSPNGYRSNSGTLPPGPPHAYPGGGTVPDEDGSNPGR